MRPRVPILLLLAHAAGAAAAEVEPTYTVDVRERRPVSAASAFVKDSRAFELRSLSDDPGDLLEVTPGLEVGQHAGGGKANQYLIRGFDADHGTDVALSVDGVPINVRSHAHGQGYADFHFVIPETIESVEITKGPYEAEVGDFATAGSVNLVTRSRLEDSYAKVEAGSFETQRYLLMLSPDEGVFAGGEDAPADGLFALEAYGTDGPFHHEEHLWRFNGFGSVGFELSEKTRLDGTFHLYESDWNASNQVPLRLVNSPGFDRFDAVDPSDGGDSSTARTLWRLEHELGAQDRLEAAGWFTWYTLDLYSNFTFFESSDGMPGPGDQILQQDDRIRYGGWLAWVRRFDGAPVPAVLRTGLQAQVDDAHVRLRSTTDRSITGTTSDDEVVESSLALFAELELVPLPWVRTVLGLRAEEFSFRVNDELGGRPQGEEHDGQLLPKANLMLRPFSAEAPLAAEIEALRELELFLNFGKGYHSNDARNVVAEPHAPALASAYGWEVGVRTRFGGRLDVAAAYWWLNLERELVYVGDEGTTEEKGRSRRRGVEVAAELEIFDWLFWQGSLGYSSGKFVGAQDGFDGLPGHEIPQAVRFLAETGLVARHENGLAAELTYRTLGERYGAEDPGDRRLRSWKVWDAAVRYRRGPFEVGLILENLFDEDWQTAEFFYESQLLGEPAPVADLHFVPGSPRGARVVLAYHF